MKSYLLFAASLAAIGLSACSKEPEPVATSATTDTTVLATETETVPADDVTAASPAQAFANTAAASDAFEIQTSQLAAANASSPKVKDFAAAMIKAHTESTAKLKAITAKATPAITPDPKLDAMQQSTLDDLNSKTGADFDKAYVDAQVSGHEKTLAALKAYSAQGDVPALKDFATTMIPTVTGHLNMAKGLQ